jgi:glutamate racemase
LIKTTLQRVLGPDITLVDSAEAVALEVETLLKDRGLASDRKGEGDRDFFVSDLSDRFLRIGERILGRPLDRLAAVAPGLQTPQASLPKDNQT